MKLRHTLVVALSALVLAAACGSKNESGNDNASTATTADNATTTTAVSGPQWNEGVTDDQITIGVHTPLKIGALDVSEVTGTGPLTQAFWDHSNQNHLVNGRKVNVVLANDGFDPGVAAQACRDLIDKGVFMISGTAGTDQIIVCEQAAAQKGITYTSLGVADSLTKDPNYFALTLTYDSQARIAAKYVMTKLDGKNKVIASVKENTANLDEPMGIFADEIAKAGGKVTVHDTVGKPPTPEDLTNECLKLAQAKADIVWTWMPSFSVSSFAKACAQQHYNPQWFQNANGGECVLTGTFGAAELDGCLSIGTNRNPDEVNPPIKQECDAAWQAARPGKDMPLGGYQLCAFYDVLRKALENAGRDLTQTSFRNALHTMNYDNGILNPIHFGKGQVASDQFVILRGRNGKLMEEPPGWQTIDSIK